MTFEEEIRRLKDKVRNLKGERNALLVEMRAAVVALAHAAEKDKIYDFAYTRLSAALIRHGPGRRNQGDEG